MTAEELLKPHYKVIADYPGNPFQVGKILNSVPNPSMEPFFNGLEKHPHLFKKLEWWEERKVEDMPGYVKTKYDEYKVIQILVPDGDWFLDEEKQLHAFSIFTPATEQEYLTYQQSKQ